MTVDRNLTLVSRNASRAITRQQAARILELVAEGLSPRIIGKMVGVSFASVYRIKDNPDLHDLIVDDVAVKRAMKGDWRVAETLTYWERDEMTRRLNAMGAIDTHWFSEVREAWSTKDPGQPRIIVDYYGEDLAA